ncbi:MAG: hypothetical protein NW203_00555 [Hyphomonadaceae bacterium]|nr:hypothetical protein [Hyphomonadaceae bacterium]
MAITMHADADARFLRAAITVMAAVLVSGFIVQLAAGRSSFNAPLIVHAHAVAFMGWVGITVAQVWLAATGALSLHRTLGRLAVVYAGALLVLGPWVTIAAAQAGRVPFFFQPQHFLFADPATIAAFIALFAAAIALRKRTDWHARLQIGAFTAIMGPGVGRILPMPLLTPYAFEIAALIPIIVLLIGAGRDLRVHGRVHPAWLWSAGALIAALIAARLIAFSPLGDALYALAIGDSPLAAPDGRAFPPPPGAIVPDVGQ